MRPPRVFAWYGRPADLPVGRRVPAMVLGQATMPMLWVTGTNDFAFP